MNKIIYITLLLLLVQGNSHARISSPENSPPPAITLIDELREIISRLEVDNPNLIKNFTEQDKQLMLKAFVDSLDVGVEIGATSPSPSEVLPDKLYKPFSLSKNEFLYVRVDSLVRESINMVQEELADYLGKPKAQKGCILDLRSCHGYEITNAIELLKSLRQAKTDSKMQLAVLMGRDTSGSSEVLIKIMETEKLGITIGSKTAGKPLPQRELTLNSGEVIKLPELNKYVKLIDIKPILPNLKVGKNNQVAYDTLYSTMNGEAGDKCISQAIDLMVSINIIK